MKKFCIILALILIFSSCGREPQIENTPEISEEDVPIVEGWTPDFKPSDFETSEEYYEFFLDEYVKNLKAIEYFETEKEYPEVILEIFDIIMERDKFNTVVNVDDLYVLGDENEFYTSIRYTAENSIDGIIEDNYLMVRMRKIEDGKYALLGRGGGAPLSHGLEKTDLTLEDIR